MKEGDTGMSASSQSSKDKRILPKRLQKPPEDDPALMLAQCDPFGFLTSRMTR